MDNIRLNKFNKTALLVGAHELVGRKLLIQLLRSEAYEKIVLLLEEPLNFQHPKLEVHQISFERLPKWQHLFSVDDVFYCWNSQMKIKHKGLKYDAKQTYAYELAELCSAAKVHQYFFLSSIAADANNVLYFRHQKVEIEKAITDISFWAIHFFRPGPLIDDDKSTRSMRFFKNITERVNQMTDGNLSKYKPVSATKVAMAMVGSAQAFQPGIHIYSAEYLHEFSNNEEGLTNYEG
ncbi:MAG: hypothetical protein AAF242_06565 [Bacteroidota bacterium]